MGILGKIGAASVALSLYAGSCAIAQESQMMSGDQFAAKVSGALKGKRVAWVPVAMAHSLPAEWARVMKQEFEAQGVELIVRDPDYNADRQSQIVASLINDKPDLLILHNFNVQLLAKQIAQAQKAGIAVMQVNLSSSFRSDAYVGIDAVKMGAQMGQDAVDSCASSPSKKIAVMKGELTSTYSMDITQGIESVLKQHPELSVVAEQTQGGWETKALYDATATAIVQNPDLCAVVSYWDVPSLGVVQALKESGKKPGDVKIITTGGGDPVACENVRDGWFTAVWNYQATKQGYQIADTALMLLQQRAAGVDTSKATVAVYSPVVRMSADNVTDSMCYNMKK